MLYLDSKTIFELLDRKNVDELIKNQMLQLLLKKYTTVCWSTLC